MSNRDEIKLINAANKECDRLQAKIKHLSDLLANQDKEVESLRELLKECLAHLSLGEIGTSVTPLNILLTRINAALGESEE